MFADLKATLFNAHFETKGEPWTADDFTGKSNREQRKRERMKDRLSAFRMSGFGKKIDLDSGQLPEWAKRLGESRKVN